MRLIHLAMVAVILTWAYGNAVNITTPAWDTVVGISTGAWFVVTASDRRKALEHETQRIAIGTPGQPELEALGVIALPRCTDSFGPIGANHHCTLHDQHGGLHAHHQASGPDPDIPTHRWYRLTNGRAIGW
jgi:hypothetical protein